MPLTDIACRTAAVPDKNRKLSDGQNLYLFVTAAGSKLWRYDYSFAGKRKTMSLDHYPAVSLASARGLRDNAKRALRDGVDPATLKNVQGAHDTFRSVATRWFEAQKASWVAEHSQRVWSRFEQDVFPAVGAKAIVEITPQDILSVRRAAG